MSMTSWIIQSHNWESNLRKNLIGLIFAMMEAQNGNTENIIIDNYCSPISNRNKIFTKKERYFHYVKSHHVAYDLFIWAEKHFLHSNSPIIGIIQYSLGINLISNFLMP